MSITSVVALLSLSAVEQQLSGEGVVLDDRRWLPNCPARK